MSVLCQFYVRFMSVLCQFYVSFMSVLCQFYVSSMSVLCQFYVRGYAPRVVPVWPEWAQRRRRRSMGHGNTGRPFRQRGARLVPPTRAPWLTPPHGRHHTRPRLSFALWLLLILLIYSPLNNFWKKKTYSRNIFIKQGNRVIWPSPRGPAVHVARRPKCKAQRGVPSRSSGASSGSGLARG